MSQRICLIGLDEPEHRELSERLGAPVVAHESVPKIVVSDGRLFVESRSGAHIHDPHAEFMPHDDELVADTRAVAGAIGLELAANDYLIDESGTKHLLELNHIPNVTRFPEIRTAYLDYVARWVAGGSS